MKKFGQIIGALFAIALVAAVVFVYSKTLTARPYQPPVDNAYYYAEVSERERVLVGLQPDATLALYRYLEGVSPAVYRVALYDVKGEYAQHIWGNLYNLPTYRLPFGFRFVQSGLTPVCVEMHCWAEMTENLESAGMEGQVYNDVLYYSEDIFVLGDTELTRIEHLPSSLDPVLEIL